MNTALAIFLLTVCMSNHDDQLLFDGKTLNHWEIIDYDGHGDVYVADSTIFINRGKVISGIRWTADFPVTNYEVTLYAKRVEGNDFFCGLTFPVKDSFLTLVLGGWGGSLSGLSCIDGADAAHNITQTNFYFGKGWWWAVRLRVTDEKIEAWVEQEKFVDFTIGGSKLSLRSEVESSIPLGITTYQTTGAIRDIRLHIPGK
jgi:hypothetical protein